MWTMFLKLSFVERVFHVERIPLRLFCGVWVVFHVERLCSLWREFVDHMDHKMCPANFTFFALKTVQIVNGWVPHHYLMGAPSIRSIWRMGGK
jgi:hypothetical protein